MTYPPFDPPLRALMGPGPSDAPPSVLRAMTAPLIGHLDPRFIDAMNEVRGMLQAVLRTSNEVTFALSAPGSGGMELCLVNLLEPGDEAVICVNGVFGGRMADIVERCGARLHRVDVPWGRPVLPDDLAPVLRRLRPKVVAVVHAETSTGVRTPLEPLSALAHDAGALFVVDAVTSLAGIDVRVDDWRIDALYSGSQKCLSAPPGLSPVTIGPAAMEAVRRRRTKVQSWFLDLTLLAGYVTGGSGRIYHHTAPVAALLALHEALRLVLAEGLEARFERHRRVHDYLREGLEDLGLRFVVEPEYRLPHLNLVWVPEGVDEAGVRRTLLDTYGIEIGGGLGEFAGKAWRIGIMGGSCTIGHVDRLLAALRRLLR